LGTLLGSEKGSVRWRRLVGIQLCGAVRCIGRRHLGPPLVPSSARIEAPGSENFHFRSVADTCSLRLETTLNPRRHATPGPHRAGRASAGTPAPSLLTPPRDVLAARSAETSTERCERRPRCGCARHQQGETQVAVIPRQRPGDRRPSLMARRLPHRAQAAAMCRCPLIVGDPNPGNHGIG